MAYIVMAYIVMAYTVMAYTVIAYIVTAYVVMAYTPTALFQFPPVCAFVSIPQTQLQSDCDLIAEAATVHCSLHHAYAHRTMQ